MRYDHLLEPMTDALPCGPDLDETGDDAYLNYMIPATDRLPARFYDSDTGAPFERASVDLKGEIKAISELLERSRDLRLLALEARFQALAGQIVGFSECLQAMAALLEERWDFVHPQAYDGDFTLRQNTLSALDDRTTIILPLEYAPLSSEKRIGPISLRSYRVAKGEVQGREGEAPIDVGNVLDSLRADGAAAGVEAAHTAVRAAEVALSAIQAKFADATGYEYAPGFDGLLDVLARIRNFIEEARPHLTGSKPADVTRGDQAPSADEPQSNDEAVTAQAMAGSSMPLVDIAGHPEATAALLAVEQYFTRSEPSSPALILVHQARTLVGQPLVVALDALLPESAERALISVDGRMGLQLSMPRMRSITEAAINGATVTTDGAAVANYDARTRPDAENIIHSVEVFFRRTEPSSPIPVLLAKARTFMNRDFSAILADIIKSEGQQP